MQATSLIRANSRQDLELERYFGKIKATCARKILVTTFDLIYLLAVNLPIFVLFAYFDPIKNKDNLANAFIDAFHNLVKRGNQNQIQAWRMFAFSVWMCFVLYIYFVFIPSKTQYQTFLSSFLGMKAVTLDDNLNWKGKLSEKQLFRANLIPVFSIPIMCAIFFYCAWITNNYDWYDTFLKNGFRNGSTNLQKKEYWFYGFRVIMVVVFFLQIHHLFTVGASTKALNWFTKSNRIIYVNVERALVVMSTEDKPTPNKLHPFDMTIPGTQSLESKRDEEEYEDDDQEVEEKIDFSEDIELSTDAFLERLKAKQQADAEGTEE